MIITIDGPAGVGKSTVAKLLAQTRELSRMYWEAANLTGEIPE